MACPLTAQKQSCQILPAIVLVLWVEVEVQRDNGVDDDDFYVGLRLDFGGLVGPQQVSLHWMLFVYWICY